MKKVLFFSGVVLCTLSATAQTQGPKQSLLSKAVLMPIKNGDAFSIRLGNVTQPQPGGLLKNAIRTVGVAAAANQTEKLVQGGSGTKPSDNIIKNS